MSIKTLAVDDYGNPKLNSHGSMYFLTGVDAVIQSCEQAMKTMRGELVYNTSRGMPDFEYVWNGSPNPAQFEAAARAILLTVPDVDEISSFLVNVSGDELSYTAEIKTQYGTGAVSG